MNDNITSAQNEIVCLRTDLKEDRVYVEHRARKEYCIILNQPRTRTFERIDDSQHAQFQVSKARIIQ